MSHDPDFLPVNFADVTPAPKFSFPQGDYLMRVETVEVKQSQKGTGYNMQLNCSIVQGPGASLEFQGKNFKIFKWFPAPNHENYQKNIAFFFRFCLECGVTEEQVRQAQGGVRKSWFENRTLACRLAPQKDRPEYMEAVAIKDAGLVGQGAASTPAPGAAPGTAQSSLLQAPTAPNPAQYAAPPAPTQPQYAAPPAPTQPQYAAPPAPTQPQYAAPPAPAQAPAQPQYAAPPAPPAPAPAPAPAQQQAGYPAPPPPPAPVPGQGQ